MTCFIKLSYTSSRKAGTESLNKSTSFVSHHRIYYNTLYNVFFILSSALRKNPLIFGIAADMVNSVYYIV